MKATPVRLNPLTYNIAPNGIFWSLQGEAHLRGFQMAFLRMARCDVGCGECDTDYRSGERLKVEEIADRLDEVVPAGKTKDKWVWVTGGEPLLQHLRPIYAVLRDRGWSIALATSGKHRAIEPVDWLSVSFHGGYPLRQAYGNELKVVDGLNGLNLDEFIAEYPDESNDFLYRYVQPMSDPKTGVEDPESMQRCIDFLKRHPNWNLSRQDHKLWGMD